jgi:hypothetical protein
LLVLLRHQGSDWKSWEVVGSIEHQKNRHWGAMESFRAGIAQPEDFFKKMNQAG